MKNSGSKLVDLTSCGGKVDEGFWGSKLVDEVDIASCGSKRDLQWLGCHLHLLWG